MLRVLRLAQHTHDVSVSLLYWLLGAHYCALLPLLASLAAFSSLSRSPKVFQLRFLSESSRSGSSSLGLSSSSCSSGRNCRGGCPSRAVGGSPGTPSGRGMQQFAQRLQVPAGAHGGFGDEAVAAMGAVRRGRHRPAAGDRTHDGGGSSPLPAPRRRRSLI